MEHETVDMELEIFPAVVRSANVQVNISTPKWDTPMVHEQLDITGGRVETVNLPGVLRVNGSNLESKGIQIVSTNDVSIYALNRQPGSCDGFLALPVNVLGMEYFVVTQWPPTERSQIAIVAVNDNTEVTVELPRTRTIIVIYNGVTYDSSTSDYIISESLQSFDVLQLQSLQDLSGSFVKATSPVSVFSGNKQTVVDGNILEDEKSHLVEQMPPVSALGTTFYIVPIPDRNDTDQIKLVTSQADTTVTMGQNPFLIQLAGGTAYTGIPSDAWTIITADKPILLAHFATSESISSDSPKDPTLMVVPPSEQFRPQYVFSTPRIADVQFTNYLMLVVDTTQRQHIQLDGDPVTLDGWTNFPDSGKSGIAIEIGSGAHFVEDIRKVGFGAYVYGSSTDHCAYAYPAGMCVSTPSMVRKSLIVT